MASYSTWFAGGRLCSCSQCGRAIVTTPGSLGEQADADPAGDKVKRLAIDATLRAAAPYQRSRRQRATDKGKPATGVFVEKSDMRA